MRVLVVGARGFVGVQLVRELLGRGHSVVALEIRPDRGRLAAVADQVEWVVGDCSNPEAVLHAIGREGVDAIYYGPYYRSPSAAKNLSPELNIMAVGALNVFNLALALDIKRIVFPSSTAVHGEQVEGSGVFDEDSHVRPNTVYGATKLLCEHLGRQVNEQVGRNVVVSVRLPSIYGPGAEVASRGVNILPVKAARGEAGQVDYTPDAKVCIAHVEDTAIFLANLMDADEVGHAVYGLGGLTVTFGEIGDAVRALVPDAVLGFGTDTLSPLPSVVGHARARNEFGLAHRDLASGVRSIVEYETRARRPS